MSDIIDNIGCAFEKVKDYVEEHPWQTAAALAAGGLLGPAVVAGAGAAEAAAEVAIKKGLLPAITLAEEAAATIATGVEAVAGAVTGVVLGETGAMGLGGLIAAGAAMGVAKAVKAAEKGSGAPEAPHKQAGEATHKQAAEHH